MPRGKGRVLNCLLAAAVHHPDVGAACTQHLAGLARRRLFDWRTGGGRWGVDGWQWEQGLHGEASVP